MKTNIYQYCGLVTRIRLKVRRRCSIQVGCVAFHSMRCGFDPLCYRPPIWGGYVPYYTKAWSWYWCQTLTKTPPRHHQVRSKPCLIGRKLLPRGVKLQKSPQLSLSTSQIFIHLTIFFKCIFCLNHIMRIFARLLATKLLFNTLLGISHKHLLCLILCYDMHCHEISVTVLFSVMSAKYHA